MRLIEDLSCVNLQCIKTMDEYLEYLELVFFISTSKMAFKCMFKSLEHSFGRLKFIREEGFHLSLRGRE